jgi:hypothetical protein
MFDPSKFKHVNLKSYLSTKVEEILHSTISDNDQSDSSIWLNRQDCILNVEYLVKSITSDVSSNSSTANLEVNRNLAKHLASIKDNIQDFFNPGNNGTYFLQDDLNLFNSNVSSNLNIKSIRQSSYILDDDLKIEFAFLSIFPIFERCLGNVLYSLLNYDASKVPFLLKDLVTHAKLYEFFNHSTIYLLKLLFYSPTSLNLRNLCWHGFLNPDQYQEHLIYFLLALIARLNFEISERAASTNIKCREKYSLKKVYIIETNSSLLHNFREKHRDSCLEIIRNSRLIDESRRKLWIQVYSSNTLSDFDLMVLILPQLEHLIRKLFSLANNFTYESPIGVTYKENFNCQKASIDEFYFTMNELLEINVTHGNNLIELIKNDKLLHCLFELFDYLDGPRLRDHLSHGELDSLIDDDYFVNFLLYICVSLCSLEQETCDFYSEFSSYFFANYEPSFHPISILKMNVCKLVDLYFQFDENLLNLDSNAESSIGYFSLDSIFSSLSVEYFNYASKSELLSSLKKEWTFRDWNIALSYRYSNTILNDCNKLQREQKIKIFKSKECQIINLLRSILDIFTLFIKIINEKLINLVETTENSNLILRERQRKNLVSFKSILDSVKRFLLFNNYMIIYLIDRFIIKLKMEFEAKVEQNLEKKSNVFDVYFRLYTDFDNQFNLSDRLIKYLKRHLKLGQNLLSKSKSNKWTKCVDLLTEFIVEMQPNSDWNAIRFILI